MSKQLVILLGPPGSGKGTLAQSCVRELSWKKLSVGNLCRMHVNSCTAIGKEIDCAIKAGKLVDDELINRMVCQWLIEQVGQKTVLIDGFPRTVTQATLFYKALKQGFLGNNVVIRIVKLFVSDDCAISRLAARIICGRSDCQAVYKVKQHNDAQEGSMSCQACGATLVRRCDDSADTVHDRLATYRYHERALDQYFVQEGVDICELDAEQNVQTVFEHFVETAGVEQDYARAAIRR